MKFKSNDVKWRGFTPETWLAVVAAAEVYIEYGTELTITSGNDGKHAGGVKPSKHFEDKAFDCRIWDIPGGKIPEVANAIKARLGKDYDVVIEKDHIHVEYDPKN